MDEIEKERPSPEGLWQVWGWLWSLKFGAGVLPEFLLIKLVGMTHCRMHAGRMQDALQGLLQGLTLTFQQVG